MSFLFYSVPVKLCPYMTTDVQCCRHWGLYFRWQEPHLSLPSGVAATMTLMDDIFQQSFVLGIWRRWLWPRLGILICRQSFLTLLLPFWCVYINKLLSASSFSTSHPWKSARREDTHHHLLISIFQTLPVPGTTNSRLVCTKCLIGIRALTQCRGSQGSVNGNSSSLLFSTCSHMYTEGAK